ncbi:MAG TPA: DUF3365 domain-containing protein [bacterium]|nr:DUF3365 domain-containing protein [bacterium]
MGLLKNIAAKFLVILSICALAFIVFSIVRNFQLAKRHTDDLIQQQAKLAMEYNLAVREYVSHVVRPYLNEKLSGEDFDPQVMSSSYVSHELFERVREKFPEYVLKFSATEPRNPANSAGPDEKNIIEYFNANPEKKVWLGEIDMNKKEYFGIFVARRMEESCLQCHGDPMDAPDNLRKIYGEKTGFYRHVGETIALDTVAIPKSQINDTLRAELNQQVLISVLIILISMLLAFVVFRRFISHPMGRLAAHFDRLSSSEDYGSIRPLPTKGQDEFSVLTRSFNILAAKFNEHQSGLERQVQERTLELAESNEELASEVQERKQAEQTLRLNERRLEAMLHLTQMFNCTRREIIDFVLTEIVKLTKSEMGYIILLGEVENIESVGVWTIRETDTQAVKPLHEVNDHPLLKKLVREATPYAGNGNHGDAGHLFGELLTGSVNVTRHINIPMMQEGKVVALVGVANKQTAYDEGDVRQLTILFGSMWRLFMEKAALEEKEKLTRQLQDARKMEAIGRLAGGVAHDFNNILTGISGYAELLLAQIRDQDINQAAGEIKNAAQRAAKLTQQLLAFSRQQVISPQVVDLNHVIEQALPQLRRSSRDDVEIVFLPQERTFDTVIDPEQFNQIMQNLLVNANEAMPRGGRVTIETKRTYLDKSFCRKYATVSEGDYIEVSVRDTGQGIAAQKLDKIFEPFFTTKEFGKGSGLGLATVYGIVEQNRGAIEVESNPDEGTEFRLYLPAQSQRLGLSGAESAAEM